MKYLLVVMVCLVCFSCAEISPEVNVNQVSKEEVLDELEDERQKEMAEAKEIILRNLEDQKEKWNEFDIPGFMKHYWKSDSMIFMSISGIRYGWEETKKGYEESYDSPEEMGELTFGVKELEVVSPDAAYLIGTWHLKREEEVGGYFSLIWRKIDGEWVIVKDHTS